MTTRWAAAVTALAAAFASTARAEPGFLGVLPVENPARLEAAAGRARVRVVFAAEAAEGDRAAELRRRYPSAREQGGRLVLLADAYAPPRDRPAAADRAATFLLDFDEPAFEPLARAVVERHGSRPTAAQLRSFVGEHVTRKDYARGLDPASRVAARREGDCTEHAVLLAALARRFRMPARVVLGIAVVPHGDETIAAGHAWAEIHEGGAWVPLDATDLPSSAIRVPFSTLRDEGPGFTISMFQLLHPLHVASVSLEPLPTAARGARSL